jgi:ATP-binding cassette, subfamily B, bacterial CvaB/MchF/RaxB
MVLNNGYAHATRTLPVVLQVQASECGLACLAMILAFHGNHIGLTGIRRRFGSSPRGTNLGRLIEIAGQLGLESRPLRAGLGYLRSLKSPAILHWGMNHYVVLRRSRRSGIDIHDPATGLRHIPWADVDKQFTGVLLELEPHASFEPTPAPRTVSLTALTGRIHGLKRTLLHVLGIALAIELLGLLLPFQAQWVLDHALITGDQMMVATLGVSFLVVAAAHFGLNLARAWIMSWVGATMSAQWINNLASHLLRLPMEFFATRHMGDVMSRFGSVRTVQATLTGRFVEGILDGATGCLSITILMFYSMKLALLVLAMTCLYAAFRWISWSTVYRANAEQLVFASRQQSELMESVRGAQTIKLANQVPARHARLANATWEMATRDMRAQRVNLGFSATNQFMLATQRVLLISFGASAAISGAFTVGMLMAFLLYADQFATRFSALIDKLVDLRTLSLHGERISDIALEAPERHGVGSYTGARPEPSIQVRNLWFRYAESEPWVFRGLNLDIDAGESVAIVGHSGCGKTTLARILLGLLEPTEGSIAVGGVDIRMLGLDAFRDMVGVVMQDDQLFAGSIADNIAFSSALDAGAMERVIAAAKAASVHADIDAMPMGYESLIGEMGASISGGQRQRIILARALFRDPRILVLDEATSHLDEKRERDVNASIKSHVATRITIAHRTATILMADRVINLVDHTREHESGSSKLAHIV